MEQYLSTSPQYIKETWMLLLAGLFCVEFSTVRMLSVKTPVSSTINGILVTQDQLLVLDTLLATQRVDGCGGVYSTHHKQVLIYPDHLNHTEC